MELQQSIVKIDLHPCDHYQVYVICVVSELTNLFACVPLCSY